MTSNVVLSNVEYNVVGKRPIRHDGVDKVTGKAQYGADIQLPGRLHGKVLRSPYAHANIRSIDTSKAEAHPGVLAVVTSKDLAHVPDRLTEVGEDAFPQSEVSEQQCSGGGQGAVQRPRRGRHSRRESPRCR